MKKISLTLFICIISSCNQQEEQKNFNIPNSKVHEANGIVIPESSRELPKIVSLEKEPKPLTTEFPSKAGGSYSIMENGKETKIDLSPLNQNRPVIIILCNITQPMLFLIAEGKKTKVNKGRLRFW